MNPIDTNKYETKISEDTVLYLQKSYTIFDISLFEITVENNEDEDFVLYYAYSFDLNNYSDFKTKENFTIQNDIDQPFYVAVLFKRKIRKDLGKPTTIYKVETDNVGRKEKFIILNSIDYNGETIDFLDEEQVKFQSLYKIINEFPRWNLYDNQQITITRWLSQCNAISEMYGHTVIYFRTEPLETVNTLSNNVVRNVTSIKKIHISVPGNELPQDRVAYSDWDLPFQDDFIIHVIKDKFEQAFGVNNLPHEKDYLYFPLLNKLYRIAASQASNKFMGKIAWWEVFLSKYEDDDCVKIDDELKQIYEGMTGFDIALDTISELEKDIVEVTDNESSMIFNEVDLLLTDGLLTKDKFDKTTVEEKKKPTENFTNKLVDSTNYVSLKETEKLREYYNKRLSIVSINPDTEAFPITMYDNTVIDKRTIAIQYNLQDFTTKNKFNLTVKTKYNINFDYILLNNFVGEIYDIVDLSGNLPLFTIKNNRNKLELIDNRNNQTFTTNYIFNQKELYNVDISFDFENSQFIIKIFELINKEKTLVYQDIYNIVGENNEFSIGYVQLYGGNFYMGKTTFTINDNLILSDYVNPILIMKQF